MKIAMIVAMSSNRVIGIENKLPWKLSADMAWFKKQTMNKVILMGRKTWESLPLRPLPGRKHIIISQNKNYSALSVSGEIINGVCLVSSVEDALDSAKRLLENNIDGSANRQPNDEAELMVIGGASIYKLMLPYCNRLYQTIVNNHIEGDAWFPEIDEAQWQEVYSEHHKRDEKNQYDYRFLIKDKV
jgi:dihydrofolate reductase